MSVTRITILSCIVALATIAVNAQSSDAVVRDKITDAVMKVYDEQMAKNPNDYNTLFARAHQHYYDGEYTAALADVNQAMLLTPKTDKELRFDEHILRARISDARQDYASEVADLRLAQELQPKSLACTDLMAKANLKMGNYDAAEKGFKAILRAESMNYDALYGLALVEMGRKNPEEALVHVDKAVSLFHAEPQVYQNRADIYTRQGNIEAAVSDLIQGMEVGNGGNCVDGLFAMSDQHYDQVMRSLIDIANKTNENGIYHYLRASIAMDHSRYGQALRDLNFIKRNNLYNTHLVYYSIAKCYLELGRFDEALVNVNQALNMAPQQPEYYILKSQAEYNAGDGANYDAAMQALTSCSDFAPQYVPMLVAKAELLMAQGNDNSALGYLNAAVANDPTDVQALLTRAVLLKKMGRQDLAAKDLNTTTMLSDDPENLRGFALSELGRDNEAFTWLNKLTAAATPGGENFFTAALFMAIRGDNFKALEYVQQALDNGYSSLYKLRYDKLSALNLGSLRDEPAFATAIDKAILNFNESD